ncbi:MAG: MFS transporter [Actinomycetia bacterium]|nr:MFS transporter [Actinomycetes bacterium]
MSKKSADETAREEAAREADPDRASKKAWIGFFFLAMALLVIALDLSITDVAVPSIVSDLSISADDASLVVTVYMVVASSMMVLMGKVSDLIGARRAFLIGAASFAIGSFITGIAPNFGVLLLGRTIQGLVLAITVPASLSLLNHEFPGGRARVLAFSIWTAVIGSAMALGPLLGGFLSTYFSWRWAFFINIPIMIIAVIGAKATVRPIAVKLKQQGYDVLGSIVLVLGVALIVFGIQEATAFGWWTTEQDTIFGSVPWPFAISATPVMLFVGVLLLIAFFFIDRSRMRRGLGVVLEFTLFKVKSFTYGTAAAAMMTAGVFGLLLVIPLFAQYILDKNPLGAGIALAPLGVGMALGGPVISRLNVPLRKTVLVMLGIQPIATLSLIPLVNADTDTVWMIPSLLINGFAWGAAFSILVSMLMSDVPEELSGVAGGTQTAARLLAGAIGGALLTTVLLGSVAAQMASVDESALTAQERQDITQLYEFSVQISPPTTDSGDTVEQARQIQTYDQVIQETKSDMANGVRWAIILAAFFSFIGFLAGFKLEKVEAAEATSDEPAAAA